MDDSEVLTAAWQGHRSRRSHKISADNLYSFKVGTQRRLPTWQFTTELSPCRFCSKFWLRPLRTCIRPPSRASSRPLTRIWLAGCQRRGFTQDPDRRAIVDQAARPDQWRCHGAYTTDPPGFGRAPPRPHCRRFTRLPSQPSFSDPLPRCLCSRHRRMPLPRSAPAGCDNAGPTTDPRLARPVSPALFLYFFVAGVETSLVSATTLDR